MVTDSNEGGSGGGGGSVDGGGGGGVWCIYYIMYVVSYLTNSICHIESQSML